jgi:hypothetical protein
MTPRRKARSRKQKSTRLGGEQYEIEAADFARRLTVANLTRLLAVPFPQALDHAQGFSQRIRIY